MPPDGAGVVAEGTERPGKRVYDEPTPNPVDTKRTATPATMIMMIPMNAPVTIFCASATCFASYAKRSSFAPAYKNVPKNTTPEMASRKFANRTPVLMMSVNEHCPFSVQAGSSKRKEAPDAAGAAVPASAVAAVPAVRAPPPDGAGVVTPAPAGGAGLGAGAGTGAGGTLGPEKSTH